MSDVTIARAKLVEMTLRPTSAIEFRDRFHIMDGHGDGQGLAGFALRGGRSFLARHGGAFLSLVPLPEDPEQRCLIILPRIHSYRPSFRREDNRYLRVVSNDFQQFNDHFVFRTIKAMEHRWRKMSEYWAADAKMIESINAHYARIARGKCIRNPFPLLHATRQGKV